MRARSVYDLHTITCISQPGGHRTRKCVQIFTLGWGHRTEFKERGGDAAQIKVGCWLAGWLGGLMIIVPILAPSSKLKLARFSAELRIQDGAECGNTLFIQPFSCAESTKLFITNKSFLTCPC